jgi:hypothetical protein
MKILTHAEEEVSGKPGIDRVALRDTHPRLLNRYEHSRYSAFRSGPAKRTAFASAQAGGKDFSHVQIPLLYANNGRTKGKTNRRSNQRLYTRKWKNPENHIRISGLLMVQRSGHRRTSLYFKDL